MKSVRTAGRHRARPFSVAALGILLAPLCGCAAGSSASFTQAPLLFAEQTESAASSPSSTLAEPITGSSTVASASPIQPAGYVAIGGNAVLPLAAVTALVGTADTTLAQHALAQLPIAAALSAQMAPATTVSLAASVGAVPVAVNASLSTGAAGAGVQIAALPAIDVQTSIPSVVAAATTTVSQVVARAPVLSTALNSAPAAGLASAIAAALLTPPASALVAAAPLTGALSKALVMTQPILSGPVAQPMTPSNANLLTASAGNLVRICLLKGCR